MTREFVRGACLPKLCGGDFELGNFMAGGAVRDGRSSGTEASRALLEEIEGVRGDRVYPRYHAQDWGRKFLWTNGGSVYIDLNHLEVCLPEVRSAFDHVAAWHAMLRIVQSALDAANARDPTRGKVHVLVNNSDGCGNAYGSHLNFLVSSRVMENLFARKIPHLLYLASFQISSIVYTGAGKVGSENGAPPVPFQLAQRADFFERLVGTETTCARPVVNERDEPHCGRRARLWGASAGTEGLARLHVIFFDNTLCQGSCLLKVGTMQILLAMLEAERINLDLLLEDPLDALRRFSHDPDLNARAEVLSNRAFTAIELQSEFLEEAERFAATGGLDEAVPRAREILDLWGDTLTKLEDRDQTALVRRLDWALKKSILERALETRADLTWESPEIKHLDHAYSSLDREEGIFLQYDPVFAEKYVSEADIDRFVREPPHDTRAYARAMLLRLARPWEIERVDWDHLEFRIDGCAGATRRVELADPRSFTRAQLERVFAEHASLEGVLDALEATWEFDGRGYSAKHELVFTEVRRRSS
jgi:proteasome accessory factor A